MNIQLTKKAQDEMEELWGLRREGMSILDLVVSEWESDPMSVQCFDLRIVKRAKEIMTRYKQLEYFYERKQGL